jgi:hypothetical protein
VALDAASPVLALGDSGARNWFGRVVDDGALVGRHDVAAFGTVALHATLGDATTLREALCAAHRLLAPGGIVAVSGRNALRTRSPVPGMPCATPWAWRSAARAAGFASVTLYVVRPGLDHPVQLVDAARPSAVAWFGREIAVRRAGGRIRQAGLRAALAAFGIAPLLEPWLMIVARKC